MHDAFGVVRGGAPTPLETAVTRHVLEQRKYKKKSLLVATRIRAEITLGGAAAPIPVTCLEAIEPRAAAPPSIQGARALGELRAQEDHAETHPEAIVALAVGRVIRG